MIIPYIDKHTSLNVLIEHVFPDLETFATNPEAMVQHGILTPKNDYVDEINQLLINRFPRKEVIYHSFDKTKEPSQQGEHEDLINSLTPNRFPPHILVLKPNCPTILLRNIDPSKGLCNRTRLICRRFNKNIIDCEITVGYNRGERVFLPRIPLQPSEIDKFSVVFTTTQFPIRLCFAMTINKAQGQTLEHVGIYLPGPVFSHGQLYVALFRATKAYSIKILLKHNVEKLEEKCTKNVVYKEILFEAEKSDVTT